MALDAASLDTLTTVMALVSASLAVAFAGIVFRSGPDHASNRRLSFLLTMEGVMLVSLSAPALLGWTGTVRGTFATFAGLAALASAYLWFSTGLESPLATRTRRPAVRAALVGFPIAALAVSALLARQRLAAGASPAELDADLLVGLPWIAYGVSCLVALVLSYSAFRHSAPESAGRRRARAYALAFGLRDAVYALGIFGWGVLEAVALPQTPLLQGWLGVILTTTPLVFVSLLTYGILSTQLFDIDLRIKVGIKRSTVATVALVVVLAAAKVAGFYLSKTYGFVAGGIAAGTMLVLAPRLNKLGDKVANTAMPQVQPTSAYVQFKKLEVYRAAVEAAQEAGVSEKEREMLAKLRDKLGISREDAAAVERDVAA